MKNFRNIIFTAFTAAVMCIGIFTCQENASAEEVWIVDGCAFDDATGALTITSDFDWTWFPWRDGDMDCNTIVTADIDTTGLNVYDSVYEDYEGWTYSGFNQMFRYCSNLVSVSFSGEVSPKAELDLSSMFQDCENLKTADLRGFSGAKISSMKEIFYRCENLESVNLSGIDTSNTTDMREMFYYCLKLKSLDVNCFDTSKVKTMGRMFYGCCDKDVRFIEF